MIQQQLIKFVVRIKNIVLVIVNWIRSIKLVESTLKNLVYEKSENFIIQTILTVEQLNKVVKRMKKLRDQNITDDADTQIIKHLITRKPQFKGYFEDLPHDPNYKELPKIPTILY